MSVTEGRQVYVRGHRIHHGIVGLVLVCSTPICPRPAAMAALALGCVCIAHDWDDRRRWIPDLVRSGARAAQ